MKTHCLVVIFALCLAHNPAKKPENYTQQYQPQTNRISKPAMVFGDDYKPGNKASRPSDETPKWYWTVEWSNWFLVIIAAVTALAVWRQAQETACATKAMERSVYMQEIAAQQWLAIENWRIENVDPARGIPNRFDIAVEVGNPTAAPVTVGGYDTAVNGFPPYEYIGENLLGPSQCYKLTIPIILSAEQKNACDRYALTLTINGKITYKDAAGTWKPQPFGQTCVIGRDGYARFTYWQPVNIPTGQHQAKNPN